jgi:transposase
MAGAYSEDLRVRLIRAVKGGISARAAARMLQVSESSGVKWAQYWRKTGRVKSNARRGHRRSPLDVHSVWLLELIDTQVDLTLDEIRLRLMREKALSVGMGSVWRFFDRHGISFKKKRAGGRARSPRRAKGS